MGGSFSSQFKGAIVFSTKTNVVSRGQKMHDRPKGCHIPEERPSL